MRQHTDDHPQKRSHLLDVNFVMPNHKKTLIALATKNSSLDFLELLLQATTNWRKYEMQK